MSPVTRSSPSLASSGTLNSPASSIRSSSASSLGRSGRRSTPERSTSSTQISKRSIRASTSNPPNILTLQYLESYSGKKDLIKRLREILASLSNYDEEDDSNKKISTSSLESLALSLAQKKYLDHQDKEVRLYTVLSCMELFYIYAPEPPWDESEILSIFTQVIKQLGNLAHCTNSSQAHYKNYHRLLEQLSEVKIACVLVEISKDGSSPEKSAEALEMTCSLVHTLLDSIRNEHTNDVLNHVVSVIASLIEEYDETIPVSLLDNILIFISKGSVIHVTNPEAVTAAARRTEAKKKGKATPEESPPDQITKSNPSYICAANVIRRTENQLSTNVSSLLSSLLNSGISSMSILTREQVYSCIYELHRIAPNVLTTIIGHVAKELISSDEKIRHSAVKLLGKLFQANSSNVGTDFSSCFREWNGRIDDLSSEIRLTVVKYLCLCLQNKKPLEMRRVIISSLKSILHNDPDVDVRIQAIHDVCDLAYEDEDNIIVPSLLQCIGEKVKSKYKIERKDALTGLARIYYERFVKQMTKHIDSSEDLLDLDNDFFDYEDMNEHEEELTLNIPRHLHQRYSWIPSILISSAFYTDSTDPEIRTRLYQILDEVLLPPSISSPKNVTGFVLLINSLSESASKWFETCLNYRSSCQSALDHYLGLRSDLKKCTAIEKVQVDAKAIQALKKLSTYTPGSDFDAMQDIYHKIHNFKDQHFFRLMSTISTPLSSFQARLRTFEEIPKRCSTLGPSVTTFIKLLIRRTAMGTINSTTFSTSIEFCSFLVDQKDFDKIPLLLKAMLVLSKAFPLFVYEFSSDLQSLFLKLCTIQCKKHNKKEDESLVGMVDSFMQMLVLGAKNGEPMSRNKLFEKELENFCIKHKDPSQCRKAMIILCSMLKENNKSLVSLVEILTQQDMLENRMECVLESLAALMEIDSSIVFEVVALQQKHYEIVDFVLNSCTKPSTKNVRVKTTSRKVKTKEKVMDSSVHHITSSINFLVSYTRSATIYHNKLKKAHLKNAVIRESNGNPPSNSSTALIDQETLARIFCYFSKYLCDTESYAKLSDISVNRVKLVAARAILRLADSSLGIAEKSISTNIWFAMSHIFVHQDRKLREGVFLEWNDMMQGVECYCHDKVASAPALRFLSFCTFIPDLESDEKSSDLPSLAKMSPMLKLTTNKSVTFLRKTCEQTLAQCRAISRDAENKFERIYKMNIMPEFVVPYTLYLLVFNDETPLINDFEKDEKNVIVTKKRLKFLFDALITSLGHNADNISFLLRMVDTIGRCKPIPPKLTHKDEVGFLEQLHEADKNESSIERLQFLSKTGREIILKFVKKDVNLSPHPGVILIPSNLFVSKKPKRSSAGTDVSTDFDTPNKLSEEAQQCKKNKVRSEVRQSLQSPSEKSHVTFSDTVEVASTTEQPFSINAHSLASCSSLQNAAKFSQLSPIDHYTSPKTRRKGRKRSLNQENTSLASSFKETPVSPLTTDADSPGSIFFHSNTEESGTKRRVSMPKNQKSSRPPLPPGSRGNKLQITDVKKERMSKKNLLEELPDSGKPLLRNVRRNKSIPKSDENKSEKSTGKTTKGKTRNSTRSTRGKQSVSSNSTTAKSELGGNLNHLHSPKRETAKREELEFIDVQDEAKSTRGKKRKKVTRT